MNRDDIIRIAQEAGGVQELQWRGLNIERFAALVEAHVKAQPCCEDYYRCQRVCMPRAAAIGRGMEREACAEIADELGSNWSAYKDTALLNGDIELSNAASGEPRAAKAIAAAIRARGQE